MWICYNLSPLDISYGFAHAVGWLCKGLFCASDREPVVYLSLARWSDVLKNPAMVFSRDEATLYEGGSVGNHLFFRPIRRNRCLVYDLIYPISLTPI